jgi:hypothetical protein
VVIFCLGLFFPQHPLIQLVGLRAAIWFLPFLLLGATVLPRDLTLIARTLAVLNLVALAFAVGEYFLGLERFFPRNAVTAIMYKSLDVGNYTFHRIPATFAVAGAYGGVMVATIPWLAGRVQVPGVSLSERGLLGAGLLAAALGTFLCGSRTPVACLFVLIALLAYQFRNRFHYLIPGLVLAAIVGYFVAGSERLQRFTSLGDTHLVTDRFQGSVNLWTLELLFSYPLGAGLGSAFGTSIPSYLQHLAPEQIGAENEYARIGVEQGLVGLFLWLAFLFWFFGRRPRAPVPSWELGGNLMYGCTLLTWGTGLIGCGVLTAIPGTSLLLFTMGVLARDYPVRAPVRRSLGRRTGEILRRTGSSFPVGGGQ